MVYSSVSLQYFQNVLQLLFVCLTRLCDVLSKLSYGLIGVNINYTNNSLIQANVSEQIAEQGEWTSKLSDAVSNGGGHTSGQVSTFD